MTTAFHAIPEAEVDRLRELAHIGASWAAAALAQLTGRTILKRVPIVHGPERFRRRGEWETGVFCEMEGEVSGLVAIFLSAPTRDAVVSLLCGGSDAPAEARASVLSEFGNILASQTVSAIAETVGGRILPGLPDLVLDEAEAVLESRMWPRNAPPRPLYIESELFDASGDLRALHVVLPDVDKIDPSVL